MHVREEISLDGAAFQFTITIRTGLLPRTVVCRAILSRRSFYTGSSVKTQPVLCKAEQH